MTSVKVNRYPESSVFYRSLAKSFPRIAYGKGCWLYDDAGKRYLDGCGGAFAANLGHGLEEMAEALRLQASRVAYVNGTAFTTEVVEELAAEIARLSPPELDKVYFLSSGSEAVEAALKLARQYWVEKNRPAKRKIIALKPGYHGNTLLALSASAREHYKKFYEPWLIPVKQIPAPYVYRCACRGLRECPACSGEALEQALAEEGPETVAAFIAEPVGGSSTGASVPRPDYYKNIRAICDRHEVLWIADEVLTGAGRTGRWAAVEHFGATPDLMTLGKGISGGYAPLSALVAPRRILDVLAAGSGSLLHAQTYSHAPLPAAAGLAALRYLRAHDLIERSADMGRRLHERLESLLGLPAVGDARGLGLLAGVEFVVDKTARKPFPRALKFAETFVEKAREAGLILWPNVGQADGVNGDLVMIAPPFTITDAELSELVKIFEIALNKTLDAVTSKGETPK